MNKNVKSTPVGWISKAHPPLYEAESEPEIRRLPNGAWYGRGGPQYTRVSGAWLFDNLNPWNIVSRKNNLYFNPYTAINLSEFLKQLNHAYVVEDKMVLADDSKLSEILGLPESWPE